MRVELEIRLPRIDEIGSEDARVKRDRAGLRGVDAACVSRRIAVLGVAGRRHLQRSKASSPADRIADQHVQRRRRNDARGVRNRPGAVADPAREMNQIGTASSGILNLLKSGAFTDAGLQARNLDSDRLTDKSAGFREANGN